MTLGELINELERLELKHGGHLKVQVFDSLSEYVDLQPPTYSVQNDTIVIW